MKKLIAILSIRLALLLTAALPVGAAVIQEHFATDPALRGWRSFGHTPLYRWNSTNQNLGVTWDSSRSNSFFALPLGTVLSKADDFSARFEVRLADIRAGSTPGKSAEFQIALGLINSTNLTRTNYFVGTGHNSIYGIRNAVEFNYFPDAGNLETFATIVASANNDIYFGHNIGLVMTPGDIFRITLAYTASNLTLRTIVTRNGAPYGMAPYNTLTNVSLVGRNDFRVDTFAVINYSDALQAGLPGSVLAHGTVDNIELTLPAPPLANLRLQFSNSTPQLRFTSATNWTYRLERSPNLANWNPISAATPGNGATLVLTDSTAPLTPAFYRIRADRP